MRIRSQADLDRANIQMAWSMAAKMTDLQLEELCRVSCRALHESGSEVRGSGFEGAGAVA
jgi:hypothetical protein